MFNDIKGTLTHFKGMEAIIQRRGGLEFIKSNPVLRTVIFWYGLYLNPHSLTNNIGLMSMRHSCRTKSHDFQFHTIFCHAFALTRLLPSLGPDCYKPVARMK